MDIGRWHVPVTEAVRESLLIDAEQVQHGGMEVVNHELLVRWRARDR